MHSLNRWNVILAKKNIDAAGYAAYIYGSAEG